MNSIWFPHVTVAAICERNGQFLMVEEHSKSNDKIVLNQPAGHVEDNESIVDAVVRETLEETCRHFTPTALLGLYRYRISVQQTYLRYAFIGTVSEIDKNLTRDPDILDTHWLSESELRSSNNLRSSLVFNCLDDYLAGTHYPLSILKES